MADSFFCCRNNLPKVKKPVCWNFLWKKQFQFVCFEFCYLRYRKTPEGLLVWTERIGKQKKLGRRKDESPGEYLRRMALFLRNGQADGMEAEINAEINAKINASMSDAEALEKLACILDRIYYSPVSPNQHICGKEELLRYAEAVRTIKKIQLPSAK